MLCWWADGRLCGFYSSKMKFLNIPLLGLKQARTVVAPHLIKSATRAQKKKSTTRKFKAHVSSATSAEHTPSTKLGVVHGLVLEQNGQEANQGKEEKQQEEGEQEQQEEGEHEQ